jgi:hypothetical protein
MGEAKRKQKLRGERQVATAPDDYFRGVIDLHMLPPADSLTLGRIRALTGYEVLPEELEPDDRVPILMAFRTIVGDRQFHVGFCVGDGERFSPTGIGVIERLMMEAPGAKLHVVSIVHEDVAWDIVQRHLRTFNKDVLLLAFSNSDVYDAGSAGKFCTSSIRNFGPDGELLPQLLTEQRRQIRLQKA